MFLRRLWNSINPSKREGSPITFCVVLVLGIFLIVLNGKTALAGEFGQCHFNPGWTYEVAAPRAAILADDAGDGDNFDQGNENGECGPEQIPVGTTVYFKSGFGYDLTWYSKASGIIEIGIAVEISRDMVDWEFVGEVKNSYNLTGPKINHGSVRVGYPFDEKGVYFVRSILTTRVFPVSASGPKEKIDEVLVTIKVVDMEELDPKEPGE